MWAVLEGTLACALRLHGCCLCVSVFLPLWTLCTHLLFAVARSVLCRISVLGEVLCLSQCRIKESVHWPLVLRAPDLSSLLAHPARMDHWVHLNYMTLAIGTNDSVESRHQRLNALAPLMAADFFLLWKTGFSWAQRVQAPAMGGGWGMIEGSNKKTILAAVCGSLSQWGGTG